LYVENQVENCLAYKQAKTIALVGKEFIEGNPVWHVQVGSKYDFTCDFWIDALQPTRVLKLQVNGDIALSRYSDVDPKDPLPTDVRNIIYRNGLPSFENRLVRLTTRYDVPVDPASWTLGGLHMKVGTAVSDN